MVSMTQDYMLFRSSSSVQRLALLAMLALAVVHQTMCNVGCGLQASGYSPKLPSAKLRVINGADAAPHSWPWAVLLEKPGSLCGGTLIRVSDELDESDIVLTAAHCVESAKPAKSFEGWKITAGCQWRKKPVDGQESRAVLKAETHEDYKPVKNDIAILKLDKPIPFSETIRPPCLPAKGEAAPIGQFCVVGGWGRNESDKPKLASDTLQQAVQPVHPPKVCEKPWRGAFVESQMICVGNVDGASGVCNGDSGGMLVCRSDKGNWVQHGVLSYVGGGGRCLSPGWPSVFTKISTYADWIQQKIKEMSTLV